MAERISYELEQEILRMYQELKSGTEIARILPIGSTTVYRVLDRYGIEHRQYDAYERARKVPTSEYAHVIERYEDGASLKELGREFNCSAWAIAQILQRNGIQSRTRGGSFVEVDDDTVAKMVKLYEDDGWAQTKIAQEFGLTQQNVSRILRRNGIRPGKRLSSREAHPMWKGGRVKMGSGYVGVMVEDDDPMSSMRDRQGYVLEHRLVMARVLGRPLTDQETVHHINGDRTDNRIENLQLRQGKHGKGEVFQCADCGSYHIVAVELTKD